MNDLDILMASGKGAVSGAGKGAALGSLIPGIGTATGAAVGGVLGAVSSGIKQNRANQTDVAFVDPMESVRLAELQQARKSILTGSDPVTQNRIAQARNIGSATSGVVSRNTGGDVGSTIDALLKTQKGVQSGVNQAISEGQARLPYFDSAVGSLAQRIAQRKLELSLMNRAQVLAENAQSRKEANVNANAIAATQGSTQTLPDLFKNLTFEQIMELIKRRGMQNGTTVAQNPMGQVFDPTGATNTSGDWATGTASFPFSGLLPNQYQEPIQIPDLTGVQF